MIPKKQPSRSHTVINLNKKQLSIDWAWLKTINEFYKRREAEMFMVVNPSMYKFLIDVQS